MSDKTPEHILLDGMTLEEADDLLKEDKDNETKN